MTVLVNRNENTLSAQYDIIDNHGFFLYAQRKTHHFYLNNNNLKFRQTITHMIYNLQSVIHLNINRTKINTEDLFFCCLTVSLLCSGPLYSEH